MSPSSSGMGRTIFTLGNSVALITGGGTGIGRAIAETFAREGAAVAVVGRRKEPLDAAVAAIAKFGGKATAIVGDISNPEGCHSIIMECVLRLGGLHILVNNAGIARFGPLEHTDDDEITRLLHINLLGTMLMTKYAVPDLSKNNGGRNANILNIGTSAAVTAVKNFSVYSAAKSALLQFTRCMALELAEQRVRVNCLNPGVVETPIFETMMPASAVPAAMSRFEKQTPLGRVGQPNDIAEAALFLCSPKASWITGAILNVDGGISLGS